MNCPLGLNAGLSHHVQPVPLAIHQEFVHDDGVMVHWTISHCLVVVLYDDQRGHIAHAACVAES